MRTNRLITLEQVVAAAAQHEVEYPAHGHNCVCMDTLIQAARRMTTIQGASIHRRPDSDWAGVSNDPEHKVFGRGRPYRQQGRVDYVLTAATRNRG